MTTTATSAPSAVVCLARVDRVERVSPAFVRVVLVGPGLADLDDPGHDTRIKLGFPAADGALPDLGVHGDDWYAAWSRIPEGTRPPLRTYTIRDVVREGGRTRLVVDLVVHEGDPDLLGPACRWALSAVPGARVLVVGPRIGRPWGGTEFAPDGRRDLLLVGDETAVPALSRVLAGVDPSCRGVAFLEVPGREDVLHLPAPSGVDVRWVTREGAPYGRPVVAAVRRHLGLPPLRAGEQPPEQPASNLGVDVWETPAYSAAGEDIAPTPTAPAAGGLSRTYAWIAGESWLVRMLRRSLVREVGLDRGQVAFMGYWRDGVSMRS